MCCMDNVAEITPFRGGAGVAGRRAHCLAGARFFYETPAFVQDLRYKLSTRGFCTTYLSLAVSVVVSPSLFALGMERQTSSVARFRAWCAKQAAQIGATHALRVESRLNAIDGAIALSSRKSAPELARMEHVARTICYVYHAGVFDDYAKYAEYEGWDKLTRQGVSLVHQRIMELEFARLAIPMDTSVVKRDSVRQDVADRFVRQFEALNFKLDAVTAAQLATRALEVATPSDDVYASVLERVKSGATAVEELERQEAVRSAERDQARVVGEFESNRDVMALVNAQMDLRQATQLAMALGPTRLSQFTAEQLTDAALEQLAFADFDPQNVALIRRYTARSGTPMRALWKAIAVLRARFAEKYYAVSVTDMSIADSRATHWATLEDILLIACCEMGARKKLHVLIDKARTISLRDLLGLDRTVHPLTTATEKSVREVMRDYSPRKEDFPLESPASLGSLLKRIGDGSLDEHAAVIYVLPFAYVPAGYLGMGSAVTRYFATTDPVTLTRLIEALNQYRTGTYMYSAGNRSERKWDWLYAAICAIGRVPFNASLLDTYLANNPVGKAAQSGRQVTEDTSYLQSVTKNRPRHPVLRQEQELEYILTEWKNGPLIV